MAREAAVKVICDRTGEDSYAPAGVTLDTMNEGGGVPDAALEITFRPVHGGDGVELIFNDLSERAERQVRELVDAIAAEGFFVLTPLGEKVKADPEPAEAQEPAAAPKAKGRPRRTFVEIEGDTLAEAVEIARARLAELLESPEADDMSVADAREALKEAVERAEYFKGLAEKDQKKHTAAARKARKAGNAVEWPKPLPALSDEVLKAYGLLDSDDDEKEPASGEGPPDSDDDDDIFTTSTTEDAAAGVEEQPDFL